MNELFMYRLGQKRGGGSGGTGGGSGGSDEGWIGDGNTHIWISLAEGRTSPMLGCCPNGTVTVDWGDGTEPDVLTGKSTLTVAWTPNHNYAVAGDYVITLTADGEMGFYGENDIIAGSTILRHSSSYDGRNYSSRSAVNKIEVGNNVTDIRRYAFTYCNNLKSITIPDSVTNIGENAFTYCNNLKSITIPDSVTNIGSNAFMYCYNLKSITIPDSVTNIGKGAFQECYGLEKIRFKSTTPPTVVNISAFTKVSTYCIISVPVGSLEAYTTATNYPSAATYTYIEED